MTKRLLTAAGIIGVFCLMHLPASAGTPTTQPATTQPATTQPAATQPAPLLAGPSHAVHGKSSASDGKGFSGKNMRKNPLDQLERMLAPLGLTEKQNREVQEAVALHTGKNQAFRRERDGKIAKLRPQMEAAQAAGDQEKIKALREQMTAARQGAPSRAELLVDVKKILTPDQYRMMIRNVRRDHGGVQPAQAVGEIVASLKVSELDQAKIAKVLRTYEDAEAKFLEEYSDEIYLIQEKVVEAQFANNYKAKRNQRKRIEALYRKHGPSPRTMVKDVAQLLPANQRLTYWQAIRDRLKRYSQDGGKAAQNKKNKSLDL